MRRAFDVGGAIGRRRGLVYNRPALPPDDPLDALHLELRPFADAEAALVRDVVSSAGLALRADEAPSATR